MDSVTLNLWDISSKIHTVAIVATLNTWKVVYAEFVHTLFICLFRNITRLVPVAQCRHVDALYFTNNIAHFLDYSVSSIKCRTHLTIFRGNHVGIIDAKMYRMYNIVIVSIVWYSCQVHEHLPIGSEFISVDRHTDIMPLYTGLTYLLTYLRHDAGHSLKSWPLLSLSKIPSFLMEPEGSLPCSHKPATRSYPEPAESRSPHRSLSP
jgi:hypothetical protein